VAAEQSTSVGTRRRTKRDVRGVALTIGLTALLVAGSVSAAQTEPSARPPAAGPTALARAVTPERLRAHLAAFAAIAKRNGGSRATGTRGYEQSVAYVVRQLRAVGYRPRRHTFGFDLFRETRPPRLERVGPGPERYRHGRDFLTLRYSGGGTVTGAIAPVDFASSSSGCEAADFAGFPSGAVALVRRGTCFMSQKARNARTAGAGAVLIANEGVPGRTAPMAATLTRPRIGIPVLMISSALGSTLERSAQAGSTQVRIAVSVATRRARAANVIAELPGRRAGAVLLGAHLDSVANGPGINDNASGSALVLEIARQARRLRLRPARALRFAFWGAEEVGLVGSAAYASELTAPRRQLAAVLNFDMVGSRNFGRFVYDGEGQPPGSERIESLLRDYLSDRGQAVEELSLGGSSDHAPFARAGVPVGGLFAGADDRKSAEAARRFGGTAGQPYDPCYHQGCDTVSNVDLRLLGQMADAAAVVALRLAG
jgi:Peptidase family M28/PA domain